MLIGFCRTSTLLIPFANRKGDFFCGLCDIFTRILREFASTAKNSAVLAKKSAVLADFCSMLLVVWRLFLGVSEGFLLCLSDSSLWTVCNSFG